MNNYDFSILSNNIKNIFEEFNNEENKQYMNLMCNRSDNLPSDIITDKFIKKNNIIIKELIPEMQSLLDNKSFQNWIIQLEKDKTKEELNFKKILLNCEEIFNAISDIYQNDLEFYRNYYKYLCIIKILFEEYKRYKASKDRFNIPINNALEKVYKENNIDLNDVDKQYNKYKLLTIDNNFEISISNRPKVYDKRIGIYLLINEIGGVFLQSLKKLQEKGYISSLALRPEYNNVSKDLKKDKILLMEEVERGKIFSFENLGNTTITKLYSTNKYDNKLWIIIDEKDITFEEFLEDFYVHDNSIVTQVIHLQYKKENNHYIIEHIDHEYIFYTEDEYLKRESNPMQRGKAKTRVKTFKIDNSKIPFILDDGSFFLYKVLDTYFVNKDLIKEYFENVLKK